MNNVWYVVMKIQRWNAVSLEPVNGTPFPISLLPFADDADAPKGFLAVFDDREKAEAWADGAKVFAATDAE